MEGGREEEEVEGVRKGATGRIREVEDLEGGREQRNE